MVNVEQRILVFMTATSYLLFFFSTLGVFNGVVLASWMLIWGNKNTGDTWFAILLLLISVRIGKSVAFYFASDLDKNILQLGLTACFLIGPCLVAYISKQVKAHAVYFSVKWIFITLISTIVIVGIVFPYSSYVDLWQYWIYRGSSYLWLVCLLLAFYFYRVQIRDLKGQWQKLFADKAFATLVGSTLIWVAYFTASYTSYIIGALSFSLILYLSLLVMLKFKQNKTEEVDKYANNKLTESQIRQYSLMLEKLMDKEQVFIDPQLTLPRLAKRLSTSHTVLSQLLNEHYQMNFKQYINRQRVGLAQKLLLEQPNASIDDIAEQSGFGASSTFYNAFKQQTGLTPNRFRTMNL